MPAAASPQEGSIALLICLCSCLTGTYSAISGLAQCTACPAGSANPHPGQSSAGACVLCENGKVAAAAGALPPPQREPCLCESDVIGAVVAGSTSCSSCQSGKFSNHNPGGTACEDTASPTAAPSQSPTGSPTSSPTAAPTACLPGTHINAIGGGCTPCEAGRPAYASSSIATRRKHRASHMFVLLSDRHILGDLGAGTVYCLPCWLCESSSWAVVGWRLCAV